MVSCQTAEDKLIDDCEKHLVSELKDPSSYERINVKIKDTITELSDAEECYKTMKGLYDDDVKLKGDDEFLAIDKKYLDESKKTLDSIKNTSNPNKIKVIGVEFKYRAKNSFGALDVQSTGVAFLPDPTIFKKGKDEHWVTYDVSLKKY